MRRGARPSAAPFVLRLVFPLSVNTRKNSLAFFLTSFFFFQTVSQTICVGRLSALFHDPREMSNILLQNIFLSPLIEVNGVTGEFLSVGNIGHFIYMPSQILSPHIGSIYPPSYYAMINICMPQLLLISQFATK